MAGLILTACATTKKVETGSQMQGDVYTGTDTVEYLASGVPDRVFFATNESIFAAFCAQAESNNAKTEAKINL